MFLWLLWVLFCYVIIMVGDQWTVMGVQTLGNELWLSLYMVMASPYGIFCSWNVLNSEILKWWCLDDCWLVFSAQRWVHNLLVVDIFVVWNSVTYWLCSIYLVPKSLSMDLHRNSNMRVWKVLCWNIRDIHSRQKWTALRSKIHEIGCDIICLQETKRENFDATYLKNFPPTVFLFHHKVHQVGPLLSRRVQNLFVIQCFRIIMAWVLS
jgi:hypothetical protein